MLALLVAGKLCSLRKGAAFLCEHFFLLDSAAARRLPRRLALLHAHFLSVLSLSLSQPFHTL